MITCVFFFSRSFVSAPHPKARCKILSAPKTVRAQPEAEFAWDVDGNAIKRNDEIFEIRNDINRSTLIVQPPIAEATYGLTARNENGESRTQSHVVDENSDEAANIRAAASAGSSRLRENITTIVKTDVERELVEAEDDDADPDAIDTVRIYSASQDLEATTPTTDGVHEKVERRVIVEPTNQVQMPQKPVFLQLPPVQFIQLKAGEPLRVEAKLLAQPPASIRWYHKNFELQSTADGTVLIDDESANYSSLTHRQPQSGIFRVVAMNEHGMAAYEMRVVTESDELDAAAALISRHHRESVERNEAAAAVGREFKIERRGSTATKSDLPHPPRIAENAQLPPQLRVRNGEPFELTVKVEARPEAQIQWRLNNFELHDGQRGVRIESTTPNESQLFVEHATEGRYEARAENSHGCCASSTKVIVDYSDTSAQQPPLTEEPKTETSEEFDEQQKDEPTDFVVIEEEDLNKTTDIQKPEESYALLVKVSESLAATLVANIIIGAVRDAAQQLSTSGVPSSEEEDADGFTLEVESIDHLAPSFEVTHETYTVAPGQTLTIHTQILGPPCFSVEWYHNDQKLEQNENVDVITTEGHAQLIIRNIQSENAGILHCRVENDFGCAQYTAKLVVDSDSASPIQISDVSSSLKSEKQQTQQVTTNVRLDRKEPKSEHAEATIVEDLLGVVKLTSRQTSEHTPQQKIVEEKSSIAETTSAVKRESSSDSSFEMVSSQSAAASTETAEDRPSTAQSESFVEVENAEVQSFGSSSEDEEPTTIVEVAPPISTTKTKQKDETIANQNLEQKSVVTGTESAEQLKKQPIQNAERTETTHSPTDFELVNTSDSTGISQPTASVDFQQKEVIAKPHSEVPQSPKLEQEPQVPGETLDSVDTLDVGLVVHMEKPPSCIVTELLILVPEYAESEWRAGTQTAEPRSITVLQPNTVKLVSKVDAVESQDAEATLVETQVVHSLEEKPSESQDVEAIVEADEHQRVQVPTVREYGHVRIVCQPVIREVSNVAVLLDAPDATPHVAEAETNIEAERPESRFEFRLRIVQPQLYIYTVDLTVNAGIEHERVVSLAELFARGEMEGTVDVVVETPVTLRTNVNYQWIQTQLRDVEQTDDVWTLQRREPAIEDEPASSSTAGEFEITHKSEEQQMVEVQMFEPTKLLGSVLNEIQQTVEPFSSKPTKPAPPIIEQTEEASSLTISLSDGGQAPRFRLGLANATFRNGRAAQLKCIVIGIPNPEVRWYVDGDVITENDDYQTVYEDGVAILRFTRIVSEDEGEYTCEAVNVHGTAETRAFVTISDENAVDETIVPEGTNVTIKCETLQPQVQVTWLKDRKDLNLDDRFLMESSENQQQHTLTISVITDEDRGEYGVLVNGAYIPVTRLNVQKEQSIFEDTLPEDSEPIDSESRDVNEWEMVESMEAQEIGSVIPQVEIDPDGTSNISLDVHMSQIEPVEEITVEITTNENDLSGQYDISPRHDSDTFEILELEEQNKRLDGFDVIEKSELGDEQLESHEEISEQLERPDSIAEIDTSKGTEETIVDLRFVYSSKVEEFKVTLMIPAMTQVSHNVIQVSSKAPYGEMVKLGVELGRDIDEELIEVLVESAINDAVRFLASRSSQNELTAEPQSYTSPEFTDRLEEQTNLRIGHRHIFTCNFVAHPKPQVEWFVGNRKMEESRNIRLTATENSSILVVEHVPKEWEGQSISCTISNPAGQQTTVTAIGIETKNDEPDAEEAKETSELKAPEFVEPFDRIHYCNENENLRLECRINENSRPIPKWTLNGTLIPTDRYKSTFDGNVLVFEMKDVKRHEIGCYECTLTNDLGSTSASCSVIIEDAIKAEHGITFDATLSAPLLGNLLEVDVSYVPIEEIAVQLHEPKTTVEETKFRRPLVDRRVRIHDSIRLEAEVSPTPSTQIRWITEPDVELTDVSFVNGLAVATILRIESELHVECRATNSKGESKSTARISIVEERKPKSEDVAEQKPTESIALKESDIEPEKQPKSEASPQLSNIEIELQFTAPSEEGRLEIGIEDANLSITSADIKKSTTPKSTPTQEQKAVEVEQTSDVAENKKTEAFVQKYPDVAPVQSVSEENQQKASEAQKIQEQIPVNPAEVIESTAEKEQKRPDVIDLTNDFTFHHIKTEDQQMEVTIEEANQDITAFDVKWTSVQKPSDQTKSSEIRNEQESEKIAVESTQLLESTKSKPHKSTSDIVIDTPVEPPKEKSVDAGESVNVDETTAIVQTQISAEHLKEPTMESTLMTDSEKATVQSIEQSNLKEEPTTQRSVEETDKEISKPEITHEDVMKLPEIVEQQVENKESKIEEMVNEIQKPEAENEVVFDVLIDSFFQHSNAGDVKVDVIIEDRNSNNISLDVARSILKQSKAQPKESLTDVQNEDSLLVDEKISEVQSTPPPKPTTAQRDESVSDVLVELPFERPAGDIKLDVAVELATNDQINARVRESQEKDLQLKTPVTEIQSPESQLSLSKSVEKTILDQELTKTEQPISDKETKSEVESKGELIEKKREVQSDVSVDLFFQQASNFDVKIEVTLEETNADSCQLKCRELKTTIVADTLSGEDTTKLIGFKPTPQVEEKLDIPAVESQQPSESSTPETPQEDERKRDLVSDSDVNAQFKRPNDTDAQLDVVVEDTNVSEVDKNIHAVQSSKSTKKLPSSETKDKTTTETAVDLPLVGSTSNEQLEIALQPPSTDKTIKMPIEPVVEQQTEISQTQVFDVIQPKIEDKSLLRTERAIASDVLVDLLFQQSHSNDNNIEIAIEDANWDSSSATIKQPNEQKPKDEIADQSKQPIAVEENVSSKESVEVSPTMQEKSKSEVVATKQKNDQINERGVELSDKKSEVKTDILDKMESEVFAQETPSQAKEIAARVAQSSEEQPLEESVPQLTEIKAEEHSTDETELAKAEQTVISEVVVDLLFQRATSEDTQIEVVVEETNLDCCSLDIKPFILPLPSKKSETLLVEEDHQKSSEPKSSRTSDVNVDIPIEQPNRAEKLDVAVELANLDEIDATVKPVEEKAKQAKEVDVQQQPSTTIEETVVIESTHELIKQKSLDESQPNIPSEQQPSIEIAPKILADDKQTDVLTSSIAEKQPQELLSEVQVDLSFNRPNENVELEVLIEGTFESVELTTRALVSSALLSSQATDEKQKETISAFEVKPIVEKKEDTPEMISEVLAELQFQRNDDEVHLEVIMQGNLEHVEAQFTQPKLQKSMVKLSTEKPADIPIPSEGVGSKESDEQPRKKAEDRQEPSTDKQKADELEAQEEGRG
ncbi:Immunoglobulin I-set domain protein [Aphelenchoides besseyi]|nr:Immunoglobulin I-set domain protein [Aphelenchoides besseyi]